MKYKYTSLTIVLIILDQISKWWVRTNVSVGKVFNIIPKVVSLTFLKNTGAAWSFLEGNSWLFIIIAIFAIVLFIYLINNFSDNQLFSIGLILMLAGTIGNLLDRILFGYVTDMIMLNFINFPVFNIADSCLTIGVLIIIGSLALKED